MTSRYNGDATALGTHSPLLFLLCGLYFSVFVFNAIVFVKHLRVQNLQNELMKPLFRKRSVVLGISSGEMFIRGFFTLWSPNFGKDTLLQNFFIFFIPDYLEFFSFSLLVLVLYQMVLLDRNPEILEDSVRRKKSLWFYTLSASVFVLGVVTLGLDYRYKKLFGREDGVLLFNGLISTLLSVFMSLFIRHILVESQETKDEGNKMMDGLLDNGSTERLFKIRTGSLSLIIVINLSLFLTRGVWDLASLFGRNPWEAYVESLYNMDRSLFFGIYVLWYSVMAIFPSIAMGSIFYRWLIKEQNLKQRSKITRIDGDIDKVMGRSTPAQRRRWSGGRMDSYGPDGRRRAPGSNSLLEESSIDNLDSALSSDIAELVNKL